MNNKKTLNIAIGILFIIAACCFAAGTVNHIRNTGEGIISSVLLTLGCICAAVFFFKGGRR